MKLHTGSFSLFISISIYFIEYIDMFVILVFLFVCSSINLFSYVLYAYFTISDFITARLRLVIHDKLTITLCVMFYIFWFPNMRIIVVIGIVTTND